MKIAYIYSEEKWRDHIKEVFSDHDLILGTSLEEIEDDLGDVEVLSVFVSHEVKKEHLEKMPNLKLIATRSTGYDHLDIDTAKEMGISVATVPSYGENTVAEFAFALLLALSRRTYESYKQVSETGSFAKNELRGFDLYDKTFGVIGTGKIGMNSVRIAKGFGMKVVAYDVFPKEEESKELGFSYVSLDELLGSSDVISIHTPYNKETHHMINVDNIEKIKKGAYIINTARGGIIETRALIKGLESGIITGAGLDVLEEEGVLGDELQLLEKDHPNADELRTTLLNHYLIDHPNVIITPHNAFNTEEAMKRIIDTTVLNMKSFINGDPVNIVK